jgi:hypothetical protein
VIGTDCTGSYKSEVCAPILKNLLKFCKSDEEFLRKACSNGMLIAGIHCPEVCATFFGPLLDWYIEEPSSDLMRMYLFYIIFCLLKQILKIK